MKTKSLWGNECFLWWGKKKETDKTLYERKVKLLKKLNEVPKEVCAKHMKIFGKFTFGGYLWIRSKYRGRDTVIAPELNMTCIIGIRTGNITLIPINAKVVPMNLRQVKTDYL